MPDTEFQDEHMFFQLKYESLDPSDDLFEFVSNDRSDTDPAAQLNGDQFTFNFEEIEFDPPALVLYELLIA